MMESVRLTSMQVEEIESIVNAETTTLNPRVTIEQTRTKLGGTHVYLIIRERGRIRCWHVSTRGRSRELDV